MPDVRHIMGIPIVIDVKGDRGKLTYRSAVPLADRIGANAADAFTAGSGNAAVGVFVDAAIETMIRNNLIAGNTSEGILLASGSLGTTIRGNIVASNKDTGIDIEGEKKGLVPDPEWALNVRGMKWYPGETISVSIGSGPGHCGGEE